MIGAILMFSFAGVAALAPRDASATTNYQGIDVSSESGTINWSDVAEDGYSFGYSRAVQGSYLTDDAFQTNWTGMKKAGIVGGATLVLDPNDSGVAQANFFISVVGSDYRSGDLLPAIDTSLLINDVTPDVCSSSAGTGCVSVAVGLSVLSSAVSTMSQYFGMPPVIYTYAGGWDDSLGDPAGYGADPLWEAQYGSTPPSSSSLPADDWYGNGWAVWQYSDSATVSGVPSTADLDQTNGSTLPVYTAPPLAITTTSLPSGTVGNSYSATLEATGGNPPYQWEVLAGSGRLPKGLKLSMASGMISGTPKKAGTSSFTIEVVGTKSKAEPKKQNVATAVLSITISS